MDVLPFINNLLINIELDLPTEAYGTWMPIYVGWMVKKLYGQQGSTEVIGVFLLVLWRRLRQHFWKVKLLSLS